MKKYLWIAVFFMTNLCFAQPDTNLPKSSTDNNLMIQLVDSKLANVNNKLTAVEQSNKADIADLKARTDEKLADKFKQLDDKSVYVGWWLNVLAIWLTLIGLLAPIGAFLLNRKIDKNIKDSQALLDKEIKKIEGKSQEANTLTKLIQDNHQKSEKLTKNQEEMRAKPPTEVNEQNKQDIERINEILSEKPESQLTAQDWFIRGLNAHNQQDYYAAITYFSNAIKLNNDEVLNSPIYSNRGATKFKLGLNNDAIRDYDKSIELDNKHYPAYFNRAIVNRELKNNKSALRDYDKVIELKPNFYGAYNNRGVVKSDLGDYAGAISDYNKAIQLDKNDADGYNNRGVTYNKLEQYNKALSDFNQAIELNPNKPDAYINRGTIKSKLGQNEEAISDFDKAIKINPNNVELYNSRGVMLLKLQQYDNAIQDYDKAIELDPKNVGAYFNKACAYALMKNKNEALNWLEKALQLDYSVENVLKDEDWKNYLDDVDFKNLIAKYNKQ